MPSGFHNWSQTAASNNTADSAIGWSEGQAPSTVNDSARAMMAVLAKYRDDVAGALTTAGTSTAYTLTTNTVFTTLALLSGQTLTVKFNATNGASPTLNVDSLGAKAIQSVTGTAIPVGMILADSIWRVTYDNSNSCFILQGVTPLLITTQTAETTPATDDELALYDLSATANRKMTLANALKVINVLTADASPAAAADYAITYDASASAVKKVLLQNLPGRLPRGYIDGCIISNNGSDATNDIDIAAGVCRDSTNAVDITVAAMTGKQLDANWAAGASAGMRNSAVGIANTTYHIYAVAKADGTQDIYAHTSTTVATVITALQAESGGTDYLYARRIGSIIRSGGAILAFTQTGDQFDMTTPVQDINNGATGTSLTTVTLTVPTGLILTAILNATGSVTLLYFHPLTTTDAAPSGTNGLPNAGTNSAAQGSATVFVRTNTSAQIGYRAEANQAARATTTGWIDPRGKNG